MSTPRSVTPAPEVEVPLDLIVSGYIPPDDELVSRYAADMRRGAVFPAVLLAADGPPFRRIDGNHRICAARLIGRRTILAELAESRWGMRFDGVAPRLRRCACGAAPLWIFDPRPLEDETINPDAIVVACEPCRAINWPGRHP